VIIAARFPTARRWSPSVRRCWSIPHAGEVRPSAVADTCQQRRVGVR